ncbi:hypothetical protein [Psychroserpens sp.]|uniref:hypothetical protein n=1 Tax=Psychroserpens sp. TaxID=2020870 RepID=UPI001B0F95C3|nr:hypothetical protein [Psychroserpens sp.]MBO6606599.1 hypothetical protein [Psychroserpens sp.]MBO6653303.1 hypothetical protein [Psychroserpens sp.]MBO6680670.1 hypothetical protein [Psychroserpens sp.]MBO6750372.1 hypothetical protein [Psychroserpens sp.]MBO6914854.1 hypothetical protein [Psychroserpens sp.]
MIVTPLDSAVLDSKEQYVFYHRMIDFTLKELIVAVQQKQILKEQEVKLFKQYCDLLLYSIEAMRVKYMYDDEENMKVDLTDSSFPNYLEFRYLFNDLGLREEYLGKLTDIEELKEEFLDTLLRKKQPISKRKLFQAASIVYYSSAKKEFIFNRFVQGKIIEAAPGSPGEYLVSWSFYEVSHNRPFICYMYFNYDGRDVSKDKDEIYYVLKTVADREMALDSMSYAIDKRLPKIAPKLIKRVDLGPIHNVFAKDENEITHAILEGIAKKTIPLESYAISFKIDEVASRSEFKEGSFFNKQVFQKWGDIFNQKYVFAPHRIIQLLYNKTPEIMNKLAKAPIQIADLK